MKILIATEKPFAKVAVDGIASLVKEAGHTLALLEKYTSVEQLYEAVSDADALIVRSDKVTKEVIDAAKNLKIVVRAGAGYDNLDLEACSQRAIVAMNTPGQNSNAVAELAIGMMIYMARNTFTPGTGSELKGKRIGLHAYGHIGSLVAKLAKGFGMEVYAYVRDPKKYHLEEDGVHTALSVEELYENSDFLSLHIPATAQTKGFIGKTLLEKLPKGACIINTARKEVINEPELIEVLEKRPDLKYATDIATENHSTMVEKFGNRVFATPKKMGAQTSEANINAGLASAEQIINFFKSGDRTFQVNK
ncbi:MAG: NAD(P)-dependent oxidoreductase [Bacteroidales bacterium]|nr:NAD(P)-dependent oxidoreductase [Bacteroidales bacterium]MDD4657222.1 NAD(P)-dependent oxidoreductase [Bacteroidales bacterium]